MNRPRAPKDMAACALRILERAKAAKCDSEPWPDSALCLNLDQVRKLLAWAKGGRVLFVHSPSERLLYRMPAESLGELEADLPLDVQGVIFSLRPHLMALVLSRVPETGPERHEVHFAACFWDEDRENAGKQELAVFELEE